MNRLKKAERNSSIELLKIAAMVLIVLSHAMPAGNARTAGHIMDLSQATADIQRLIIVLYKYGGKLGNLIFIVCSAWFLLESNRTNLKKIFYILADCFVISVLFLVFFLCCGYKLPVSECIQQFFPTWMEFNWFIGCYLLLYLIHPALNRVLDGMDKKSLLLSDIFLFFIYCVLGFVKPGSFYYSVLIGFICIYFFVAYMKKYLIKVSQSLKINRSVFIISTVCNLCLIMVTDLLGLQSAFFSDKLTRWSSLMNPFMILMALSLFNIVRRRKFVSKSINYLSGLSLLLYIIHDNCLITGHLRGKVFGAIWGHYTYRFELVWVTLTGIVLLVGGLLLSILYKETIQRVVYRVCDRLYVKLNILGTKAVNFLLKLDS